MRRAHPLVLVAASLMLALAGCTRGAGGSSSGPTDAELVARKPAGTSAVVIHLVGDGSGSVGTDTVPMQCTPGDEGSRLCWAYPPVGSAPLRILPTPGPSSSFGGWLAGTCASPAGQACTVPSDRDQVLAAGFRSALTAGSGPPRNLVVNVLGSGSGTITASGATLACTSFNGGIAFSQLCWGQVAGSDPPPSVTLRATPRASDSTLGGWGAACAGVPGAECTLSLTADATATVTFLRVAGAVPPPPPTLSTYPSTATIAACQQLTFLAQVPPGTDPTVTWSVLEPGGGAVWGGYYLAPSTAGTYHVVATSASNPSARSVSVVTVGPEKVLSVAVAPGSVQVPVGGGLAFHATVTTTCGTFAAN